MNYATNGCPHHICVGKVVAVGFFQCYLWHEIKSSFKFWGCETLFCGLNSHVSMREGLFFVVPCVERASVFVVLLLFFFNVRILFKVKTKQSEFQWELLFEENKNTVESMEYRVQKFYIVKTAGDRHRPLATLQG